MPGGVIRTLRAAASRGALCAAPWGGNIENRAHHRYMRVTTRRPDILTRFLSVGRYVFGRALQTKRPLFSPQRMLRAPQKLAQVIFSPLNFLARPNARVLMYTCKAASRNFFGRGYSAVHGKTHQEVG